MGIVSWLVLGLIVGVLANVLARVRFPGGFLGTLDRREEPKRGGSRAVRCDATEIGLAQTRKTSIMAPTSP
jgi:hypothetical protein